MTQEKQRADRRTWWSLTWMLLRKVVSYEVAIWRSLWRWTRRRPAVPEGADAFGYSAAVTPIMWVFIAVSAIEIPILHLLLPWQTAQRVSLGLGIWGLLWMVGLLASMRVHPHVICDAGLGIRYSFSTDFTIPWNAIATIDARYHSIPPGGRVQVDTDGGGRTLILGVGNQTAVDLVLRQPTTVPVPKTAGEPVTALRFNVDDPAAFAARARERAPHLRPTP
jgi:hypothetical protein